MTQEFNFEEAMNRLSQISTELEREDIALDTAIALFEEGLELSKKCQLTLETYENKVKDLVQKHKEEVQ